MYSVVMMMMMTTAPDAVAFGRHGCGGCHGGCGGHVVVSHGCGGCYGGCHGCHGGRMFGGGRFRHGCYGGCYGDGGCYGYSAGCGGYVASSCDCGGYCGGGMDMGCSYCAAPVISASTVAAAPMAAPGLIVVSLPADAKVTIDGHLTTSTSENRRFQTPNLTSDASYVLSATIVRDGRSMTATRTVTVRAGGTTEVKLNDDAFAIALARN